MRSKNSRTVRTTHCRWTMSGNKLLLQQIADDLKELRDHGKDIAALKVWNYVLWALLAGSFILNLKLHGLW